MGHNTSQSRWSMSDKIKLVVTSNRLHLLLMANRWPTMSVHQECAYLQEHSSDTCCFRVRGYYPGIYDGGGGSYQFIFNLILLTQSMVNALDSNLCSLKSEKCSSNNITTKWFGVWNCCWCREVTSGFRATDFFFSSFFSGCCLIADLGRTRWWGDDVSSQQFGNFTLGF